MTNSRTLQKEHTREHLYEIAMRLFETRGFEHVNIDEIVRASKVARGTFYFHFPSKDDVLMEAIRRGELHIISRISALPQGAPLRQVLTATCEGFAEAWGHRREILPHAGTVALRRIAAVHEVRENDPMRFELGKRFDASLESGELRSILPGQMLSDIFLFNVFAGLLAWATRNEPPLEVVLPGIIDLFLLGVERIGT